MFCLSCLSGSNISFHEFVGACNNADSITSNFASKVNEWMNEWMNLYIYLKSETFIIDKQCRIVFGGVALIKIEKL